MQIVRKAAELRVVMDGWKAEGDAVAWVPTMGNLHAGHLHLVESARRLARRVVVSIFVNPFQFGPHEDFAAYPRTPEEDARKLDTVGTDLLFTPDITEVYPRPPEQMSFVEVPDLSHELCGRFRPGHFRGVATVVLKLFNMIQPDWAVFGAKDYQQWLIVNRMVSELNLPLKLHAVATQREPSGLALSSRNAYLSAEEKARAGKLYRCLQEAARELEAGKVDYKRIEERQTGRLTDWGFQVDYFSIRQADDLGVPESGSTRVVILVAARLGKTRLIDNLTVQR